MHWKKKEQAKIDLFRLNTPPTHTTYQILHLYGFDVKMSTTTTTALTTTVPTLKHTNQQANQKCLRLSTLGEGFTPKGMWVFSPSMEFSLFFTKTTGFSPSTMEFLPFFFFFFFLSLEGFIPKRHVGFLLFYGVFPLFLFSFLSLQGSTPEDMRRFSLSMEFFPLVFAHLSNLFSSSVARRDVSAC
jgi:hypothetical protein